jgi:hypothetical protein
VSEQLKFFSDDWCAAALSCRDGDGERKVTKNPDSFTHVLAFEVTDRPELVTHMQYVAGHAVKFSATDLVEEDQVWARFKAKAEHFREAVEGRTPAANLVMRGSMRLVKGSMKDAIANAEALNVIVRNWGKVPTDWDA